MALYTVSITDGTTLSSLSVSAGRGPKGDGWTGVTYDNNTGRFTFTSNDGLGYVSDSITADLDTAVTDAEAAQAAAEAAQAATENIFDQFGDQYLGPKASDPTVDNDGDPLTEGDIYFNTTDDVLKFYSGSAWVAPESIATTAATAAQAAQTAAETAETNAETAETNAATSASNASTSETNAANSATAAAASATEAQGYADSINPDNIDINGGTIDGTVIGGSTPAAGSFTTGSFTGNVSFGDNDKAIFGAGSNLEVYYDSATNIIDTKTTQLKILGSNTNFHLTLENTDGGAASAPDLVFYRNSSSPADDDFVGRVDFRGNNDLGSATNYSSIIAQAVDVSSASIDGALSFRVYGAGTEQEALALNSREHIGSASGIQAYRIASDTTFMIGQSDTTKEAYGGSAVGNITPALQVESTNTVSDGSFLLRANYSGGGVGGGLYFARTRGTTTGSNTVVQDGDFLGQISWSGADGTDTYNEAASISARVTGTPSADDMPTRLRFDTNGGAKNATTRLRISPDGTMSFNNGDTANSFGSYDLHQVGTNTDTDGLAIISTLGSSMRLYVDGSGVRNICSGDQEVISFSNVGSGFIKMHESVGINTDAPDAPLHIVSGTTSGMLILEADYDGSASAPDLYFYNNSASPADGDNIGNILFQSNSSDATKSNMAQMIVSVPDVTAGTENSNIRFGTMVGGTLDYRLHIDESGRTRVGTGGDFVRNNFSNGLTGAELSVEGDGATTSTFAVVRNSNNPSGGYINLAKTRGSAVGGTVVVQDGDTLGNITFQGYDGTNFTKTAQIQAYVNEATPSADNVGAGLNLQTGQSNSSITRINITASGRIGMGGVASTEGYVTIYSDLNTFDGGLSIYNEAGASTLRMWVGNDNLRHISGGNTDAITFHSDGSTKTNFPNGAGINVYGDSIITHTDFDPVNLGATPPTLYVGYNLSGRTYDINPSTELVVERASDTSISIITSANENSSIWFGDPDSQTAGQINYVHSNDSMQFRTAETTAMTISSSGNLFFGAGNGIDFSASEGSGASSSLLDDYEEGTYEPDLSFAGDNTGITYSNRAGSYTKVGRLVTAVIRAQLTNNGTATTGTAQITLPFAVADATSGTDVQGGSVVSFTSGVGGTVYNLHAHPWEGTSTVRIYYQGSTNGTSSTPAGVVQISNTFDCRITVQYFST